MKNIKCIAKKAVITLFLLTALLSTIPVSASANRSNAATSTVTPKAHDIRWIYKKIDGKLYKRLYNHTTRKWVGDWILVQ